MQTLTSRENETVKSIYKLRQSRALREQENRFFAEGLRLCTELGKTLQPQMLLATEAAWNAHPELLQLGGETYRISEPVADKLAETNAPQGVYGVFPLPVCALEAVRPRQRWLVLEHVQDPANVGAMLRSAAAFGFAGCVLAGNCADPFGGKALRASMGAAGRIAVARCAEVAEAIGACRAAGLPVYAAALRQAQPLASVRPDAAKGVALLIGNEGNGLTDEAIDLSDAAVRIPITDQVESLNAAAAAAVLLWHFGGGGA